jgi:hypothetical protein
MHLSKRARETYQFEAPKAVEMMKTIDFAVRGSTQGTTILRNGTIIIKLKK